MTIGLFAPLPLAIMIPFMAAQSFAMGQAFGTSFQYGKRKISSMSNEEFNALNAEALHKQIQADIRTMIPSLNQSFAQMEKFQSEVVNSIIKGVWETLQGLIPGLISSPSSTETSTSFASFGEGGTVTTEPIRFGGGNRTSPSNRITRSQALAQITSGLAWTKEKIDDAAKWYMDVTGLSDFQEAKRSIAKRIAELNRPAPFVRAPLPVEPHTFQKLIGGLSLVEINSNIANYRANIKTLEISLAKASAANLANRNLRLRLSLAAKVTKIRNALRQQKSLLLDWLKKGKNYQILLKNR